MPETLLKKRKQTEKAREERLAAAAEARKVSSNFHLHNYDAYDIPFDEWLAIAMKPSINHLSGLNIYPTFGYSLTFLSPGIEGEAKGHLQARRIICERVLDPGEGGDQAEASCAYRW